ncbi:hypothetical protein [Aquimarina algicola]|uniref:Nuclear transport factor 2 family protein n=1 Tax=Aquimarina algicola TaxID=2589995 RepID=A0A504IT75_9FLAO|nr:hypothetical protein [Aquimarina algicola]TPN81677.1 hypothetical protein FHK87_24055 [Aquimarina algicola]
MDYKVLKEIDNIHQMANEALAKKQFDTYMNIFSDTLEYKQFDGSVIDKDTLSHNTLSYFGRIKNVHSQYDRVHYSVEEHIFTENIIQKARVSIKVFIFFIKTFTVEREGNYIWRKKENTWKIEHVEIFSEHIF